MVVSPETQTLKNNLEMEVICPICLDLYSDPVYLSCAHLFCFECSKKWMEKKEDLIMTCPICREEQTRPIKYDRVMRELAILLKQHGPLLQQHKELITGLLGQVSENMALAAKTGDSSLEPSNDLRHDCGGKPGHNMVEDLKRFTPSACVTDSLQFLPGRCWEVDVEKDKEWAPGTCKEQVMRRNLYLLLEHEVQFLGKYTRGIRGNFLSERYHRGPGLCQIGNFPSPDLESNDFTHEHHLPAS